MTIEDDILHEVHQSLDRCGQHGAFFDKLGSNFKAAGVPAPTMMGQKYKWAKEDLVRLVMLAAGHQPEARAGAAHMSVPPQLYKFWIDGLMATVREFDEKFSPELERKWRLVLHKSLPPVSRFKLPA